MAELLTVDEMAKCLGVKPSRLYQETRKRGEDTIPCVRIGKYIKFTNPDGVVKWFNRKYNPNYQYS